MSPSTFRRVAGGAAATLLIGATLLSTAGLTLATVPSATATSEAIPAQYSATGNAGFRGFYHYTDGSTLAKLFLDIPVTGADSNVYLLVTRNGKPVACAMALPVACVFKSIRFDEQFVVVAAFHPIPGSTSVSATIGWSTTGSSSNDGGTSHGDTWPTPLVTQTATLSTDSNYGGGFNVVAGGGIGNGQSVSASNRQATRLANLQAGLAATVLDGATNLPDIDCIPNDPSTPQVDCSALIGEWSDVSVGDGQSFDTPFTVLIVFYSGTPKGFVHTYFDANGDPQQEFIGSCAKKNPVYPCFTWSASTNTATIYTFHNGSYKGQ